MENKKKSAKGAVDLLPGGATQFEAMLYHLMDVRHWTSRKIAGNDPETQYAREALECAFDVLIDMFKTHYGTKDAYDCAVKRVADAKSERAR